MSRYLRIDNEDGTFTDEKVYTAQDMEAFAEWCCYKGWEYQVFEGEWWNERDEIKTTAQLRELWEQERKETTEL